MKLSPLDIYNKEFKKSALGYNKKEVEEFLEDVGMAYEKLLKEINSLQDENDRLKQQLNNYEKIDQKLQNTLQAVQDTVEKEREKAKKEADVIRQKAKNDAEQIKKKARKEVEKEYKKLENVKEQKKLFEIRFKTLLENHIELFNKSDEKEIENDLDKLEEDIAATDSSEAELD